MAAPDVYLPYHRYRLPLESTNLWETVDFDEYDLFCVTSRLTPFVHEHYGNDIKIAIRELLIYTTKTKPSTKQLAIQLLDPADITVPITNVDEMQQEVDRILEKPQHCLLYSHRSRSMYYPSKLLPDDWVASILPLLTLDDGTISDPIVIGTDIIANLRDLGKYELHYFNTRNTSFKDRYNETANSVENQLVNAYKDGWIMNPTKTLIDQWKLIKMDNSAYKPNWINKMLATRYGGLTGFLRSVAFPSTIVDYVIGDNETLRHIIVEVYPDAVFAGNYLKLVAAGPDDTKEQSDNLEQLMSEYQGTTLVLDASYKQAREYAKKESGVVYKVMGRGWVYSRLYDPEVSEDTIENDRNILVEGS